MAIRNPLQIEIYSEYGSVTRPQWRWRMFRSGRLVAISPEGYVKRAQCRRTLLRLLGTIASSAYSWKDKSDKNLRKTPQR